MEWVLANLHKRLKVEQLAERSGMAPRSFHRRFLARTRLTRPRRSSGFASIRHGR